MKFFQGDDVVIINGRAVRKIYGGFATGQPAILAKHVADLHEYEVREINQLINYSPDWFGEGIDLIDLIGACQKIMNDFIEKEKFSMEKDDAVPEKSPENLQTPVSQAPKNYRGWNLNSRGKNRKGEILFNLAKKIGGKKQKKYLGAWNQEKADRIIDEMSQNDGNEQSENNL